jgi:phage/plasmid-associated DNA primase
MIVTLTATIRATELPGITRRGVNGLRRLMARRRFARPLSAQEAFDEFEGAVDQVRAWERERCDTSDAAVWTSRTELYDDYRVWAVENEHTPPLNAKSFYERLEQAGVKQKRSATGRYFLGIRLVSPTQEPWPGGL